VIEEEADRLTELIENLLEANRLQMNGMRLKKADIHFYELANRLAERCRCKLSSITS
jgi:K+-sensing histidine kinase KdpD